MTKLQAKANLPIPTAAAAVAASVTGQHLAGGESSIRQSLQAAGPSQAQAVQQEPETASKESLSCISINFHSTAAVSLPTPTAGSAATKDDAEFAGHVTTAATASATAAPATKDARVGPNIASDVFKRSERRRLTYQ